MAELKILAGKELKKTYKKYSSQKVVFEKLMDFLAFKNQNPCNGNIPGQCPGYNNDKRFTADGNFSKNIRGISHAHLTHNLSIVYLIHDDYINLYGIYAHDDIGTGNPPNMRRQEQAAQRWDQMDFDTEFDPSVLKPKTDKTNKAGDAEVADPEVKPEVESEPEVKSEPKPAAKVDYTPKAKRTPPADSKMEFAKTVDSLWPQRNLFSRMSAALNRPQLEDVLQQEAKFLINLQRSNPRYQPNQIEYIKKFQELYSRYTR